MAILILLKDLSQILYTIYVYVHVDSTPQDKLSDTRITFTAPSKL